MDGRKKEKTLEEIEIQKQKKRDRNNEKTKLRYTNDPIFKIKRNTRSLLYNAFKRSCKGVYGKSLSTETMLGCSMDFFIKHIESLFTEGMTFDNYGKWHLDHIKPLANCKNLNEIIEYNHYTNLQPLWASDNIRKSNK